jgi:hypothetical protein
MFTHRALRSAVKGRPNPPLYADETRNGIALMKLTVSFARPYVRVAFRG